VGSNWRDSLRVGEVYRSLRPFLDDYIQSRSSQAVAEMATAALSGDHNKATVHAAKFDLLGELLEDLEMYMAQELAIRGIL